MDTTQLLLITIILVLTIMLVLIGVQVIFILKEFKKTVEKMNKILEDTGVISESISRPVSMVSEAIMNIKAPASFLGFLFKHKKSKEKGA
jgi:hypothetical protein